jgi:hypothetical protein
MYSYELFMRHVAPEFQGSTVRATANIDWIERQDGRFIQAAANAWEAAKIRYQETEGAPQVPSNA